MMRRFARMTVAGLAFLPSLAIARGGGGGHGGGGPSGGGYHGGSWHGGYHGASSFFGDLFLVFFLIALVIAFVVWRALRQRDGVSSSRYGDGASGAQPWTADAADAAGADASLVWDEIAAIRATSIPTSISSSFSSAPR